MHYPHLFSPASIGTLLLPNRIIMGSMHLGYEGMSGGTQRMADFYAARARGGAALLITGGCAINQEAIGGANFSCIYKQEDQKALESIAQAVHTENGKIGLQLFHAGRYAKKEWLFGLQPVAPSPIRSTLHPTTPREMTAEDIYRTISDFGEAAARAKNASFDCVEIMGSEGYLINQFFSPLTNRRQDEWGGSTESRARFAVEVLKEIRRRCGREFPVIYRISGIDLMPGSSDWEDTFSLARLLEEWGADAFNIGIGWHESRIPTISMLVPRAYYAFAGAKIKQETSLPCICSNRVNDPDVAETVLREGKADFVSLARALLADPDFAVKASEGRAAFINTCIACNQACLDNAFWDKPTTCILNPSAGREAETKLEPAVYRKSVAVIGAGPGGLEAAKVLAARGHKVTLFEKQEKIGGQLLFAVRVPGKEEFFNTIRYYENYLSELKVRCELGVSPAVEDLGQFDAVVVATGARPRIPDIAGIESNHCVNYEDFFRNTQLPGEDILIMGAGGIGCDIAHVLSEANDFYPPPSFFENPNNVAHYEEYIRSLPRTRQVALARRGKRIGEKLGPTTRWSLIQLLENRGIQMFTQLRYLRITPVGLLASTRANKTVLIPAHTIVFATGQMPDNSLYDQISGGVEECYLIGAAKRASETNCMTAIWEAAEIGRKI